MTAFVERMGLRNVLAETGVGVICGRVGTVTQLTVTAFTHRGLVREANEDTVAIDDCILDGDMDGPSVFQFSGKMHLVMVADGMGHAHGALASRAALKILSGRPSSFAQRESCEAAIAEANTNIYDLMNLNSETVGMGTTLVGVALSAGFTLYFNVGDSRAYRHKRGALVLLSHDDVPSVSKTAGPGRATYAITQALGGRRFRDPVKPHIGIGPALADGEAIFLCSDGVTDVLNDISICATLDASAEPDAIMRVLIEHTIKAGAPDNFSMVLVRAS